MSITAILITIVYLFLMLAGLVWVGSRISEYYRKQQESESKWDELLVGDDLKKYLETLKKGGDKPDRAGGVPRRNV